MPRQLFRTCLAILWCVAAVASAAEPESKLNRPEILMLAQSRGEIVRNSESALLELKYGDILTVWPEYTKGPGDSDFFPSRLVAKNSTDGGHTWGPKRVVLSPEPGELNTNSPSLVRLPQGRILLCFQRTLPTSKTRSGMTYPPSSGAVWFSDDEGQSFHPLAMAWKEKEYILANGTMKRLSTGRIINTVNRDVAKPSDKREHFQSGAYFSDDQGKTWRESATWADVPRRGAMEPRVEELRDGKLLMVMRTQLGSLYKSESTDGGLNWPPAVTMGIESPEACPDILRIPKTGDLLLIWNAAKYDPQWASHYGKRTPLSVAVSKDDGRTWSAPRHLETDPGSAFTNPGCTFTSRGTILISYWTCRYTAKNYMAGYPIDLKLAIVPISWLYNGK